MKHFRVAAMAAAFTWLASTASPAQTPAVTAKPEIPDWAIPGSATHKQGPPPPDFHRATVNLPESVNGFSVSDVGAPLVPGSHAFAAGTYTISSAGYNIWYTRDEFRFLWKRMQGDVSIAANIAFPDPNGYGDRKGVLVIRQDLEDDSQQVVVALHGQGMIQLAQRPQKGALTKDREFRIGGRGRPEGKNPDSLVNDVAQRVGLEKRGDKFALFVSVAGEPMTQYGPPIELHFKEPFYVGFGFCSHLPDVVDSATFSNVVVVNKAGKVH
jgi:hypothetical protein